jgi:hypothetical protein
LFETAHGLAAYHCGPQETVEVTVALASGPTTYKFKPSRTNIMSYFFRCPEIGQRTLTPGQVKVVRQAIEDGPRKPLLTAGGSVLGPVSVPKIWPLPLSL